jgi:hypothetical protein
MDTGRTGVVPRVKVSLRLVLVALTWVALAARVPAQPAEILTADKLAAGMKGYGVSDLGDGKGIQRFEVEILGVLKRYAPRQDLILARVSGAGLEQSGIIAGMSGSPVYVDDKLIGALAYGWPFAKDPICGITPIQSMLNIRQAPSRPPVPIVGPAASRQAVLSAFGEGRYLAEFDELLKPFRAAAAAGDIAALPLPVSVSGLSPSPGFFGRIADAAGWMAAPSGASAPSASSAVAGPGTADLKPGAAVATILLSGDMDLAATGTVTWVDGKNLLAFGHPFLSMGPVDMPMARADVLTVLPSVYRSFKFAGTGPVLGSISQDRATGIFGTFGAKAAMVPITVRMTTNDGAEQVYRFQAVHNPMLTPILSALAIDSVLTTLEKRTGERTLVWKSTIRTNERSVRWDSVFSGIQAREEAVASLALLTNFLMANEFRDLKIEGVDVEITHNDRLQRARITRVEAGKEKIHAGETVPVWVDLADFRGANRRVEMHLVVPADTPPGPLTVFVGDGSAATAYDLSVYPPDPQSLDQVLDFLARLRPANSLNLLAYRRALGAVVAGEELPALPASVAAILRDRGPGDGTLELGYLRLQADSVEQPVPISGSVRLRVDVQPRIW